MKTLLTLLAAAGLAGAAFAAENWTKDQQEVVSVFDRFAQAMKSGDAARTVETTDHNFTGWDMEAPAPMDREAFRKFHEDFFAKWKVVDCTLAPVSIRIERDLAITHGTGSDTMRAADGTLINAPANWSATLVRRHGRWLFLSWSWIADRPKIDEAAIRDEVKQVFLSFRVACETANLAAKLAFIADVPEFRYVDTDGKGYDYVGHKQLYTELFAGLSAVKIDLGRYEVTVLGADAALVLWTGAVDFVPKEGLALHAEPYSAVFLWKRLGGAWKLVLQAESALPPQPVAPPPAATPATVPPSARAANEVVVREFYAAIDRNDFEKIKGLVTTDFAIMTPGLATPWGFKELCQVVKQHYAAFPDWKHTVEDMVCEGDTVAVRLSQAGTHWAAYEAIPATGTKATMPQLALFVVANGKIRSFWVVEDYLDFMKQLGMELKPRAPASATKGKTPP